MKARGLVLWAQPQAANLGVAALAAGTTKLAKAAWPGIAIETQYYDDGPAPHSIAEPKQLVRDWLTRNSSQRDWLTSYDVVLDTHLGDSFADIYGLRRLRNLAVMSEFTRRSGLPLVLTPQTIGPFNTRRGRLLATRPLRHADVVLCRDPVSAGVAAELGCPNPVVATDVAFALETPPSIGQHDVLLNVSGLLWNSNAHGPAKAYRSTIKSLIADLRTSGREVTLLAHVLGSATIDNDVPAVKELGQEQQLPVVIPSGLDEARGLMRGSQLVIGSRMHACLNSISVGTPAVALAYSRKFRPLFADLGWDAVVELSDPDAARRAADLAGAADLVGLVPAVLELAEDRLGAAIKAMRELA